MQTEENVKAPAPEQHQQDDLTSVMGIGPKFSAALHRIGIYRFEDLAQYTPQTLSEMLREQAEMRIPPERIEAEKWIDQAAEFAKEKDTEPMPPEEAPTEATEEAPEPLDERQIAEFTVFFDSLREVQREQEWQVRLYHMESGDETVLPGLETSSWVNWILDRVRPLVTPEPMPAEPNVAEEPAVAETEIIAISSPSIPSDISIDILDVNVSESVPSLGERERRLEAEVHFQISGDRADTLADDRVPFRTEFHTVNLETRASNLSASEMSTLQPQGLEYKSRQAFPMPELGRYQLHTIVLLLPPLETVAFQRGPFFKVIP
jgi:hypothetical protein